MASKPRRTRTKAPGVYRSCSGSYEIQYRDSDGRNVFKAVPGSLEDAKAARADVVGKLSRGEKIRSERMTFGPYAETVIAGMTTRPRTIERHRYNLDRHLAPRLANRRLADIDADGVAKLVAEMGRGVAFEKDEAGRYRRTKREKAYSGSTIAGVLNTLGLVLGRAKRRGLVASNPVADLERGERPTITSARKRALDDAEITKLLTEGGDVFGPMLAVLIFAGLRLGELLGLQWGDVDTEARVIHVRRQLGRDRTLSLLKTGAGERDVVLIDQLAKVLAKHKLASNHCGDADLVFAAADGRGREHRSVSRGIERAVERAEIPKGTASAHVFRHTFISRLIAMNVDAVRVSRQAGHKSPAFTQARYAHEFERARHAAELREQIEGGYGQLLDVNAMSTGARKRPKSDRPRLASVGASRG